MHSRLVDSVSAPTIGVSAPTYTRTLFFLTAFTLKSVIVLSCVSAIFLTPADLTIMQYICVPILLLFILGHHLLMAFKVEFLFRHLNLLICLAQIAGLAVNIYMCRWVDRWSSQNTMTFLGFTWALLLGLSFETVLRFWLLGRYAVHSFSKAPHPSLEGYLTEEITKSGVFSYKLLLGRSIWRAQFLGEANVLRRSRGGLAVILVIAITVYSGQEIVLGPARETGLLPIKETRSVSLPRDFPFDTWVWNVVVTRATTPFETGADWDLLFHDAVQVIPLWDQSQPGPPCAHVQGKEPYEDSDFNVTTITVHCPARGTSKSGHDGNQDARTLRYQDGRPDLLVILNYTTLQVKPDSIIDMARSSVEIQIGMTNNTYQVVRRTVPLSVPPGVNLLGNMKIDIRQVFKKPSFSAFGLFDLIDTFPIVRMVHVFTDPQAGISPLIPRSPEISTLRTYVMIDSSEWTLVQDNRYKSVIRGLSDVGGLWAFLSGAFAMIFGISLMRVLFGFKPISIFGMAHLFQTAGIKKACIEEYPKLQEEFDLPKKERGILSLLSDHLIDLDIIHKPSEMPAVRHAPDEEVALLERSLPSTSEIHTHVTTT